MNANPTSKPKRPFGAERPFPWRCRHCGASDVYLATIRFDTDERYDGRDYHLTIPSLEAPVCRACHQMVVTEKVDDQLNAALRAHLHLLTPEEIRAGLEHVGMSQKDAAESLGIADEILSSWLNEFQIQ